MYVKCASIFQMGQRQVITATEMNGQEQALALLLEVALLLMICLQPLAFHFLSNLSK